MINDVIITCCLDTELLLEQDVDTRSSLSQNIERVNNTLHLVCLPFIHYHLYVLSTVTYCPFIVDSICPFNVGLSYFNSQSI